MLAKLIGGPDVKNAEVSHYFIAMNRGKRSITLNLRKPEAVEIIKRMTLSYDVLLTNYRPGVLDRKGLGFEDLHQVNPRLIFGQASSWARSTVPRCRQASTRPRTTARTASSRSAMRLGSSCGWIIRRI